MADAPTHEPRLDLRMFWYVVADSSELRRGSVLARTVLGEALALFRDTTGRVAAIEDRCRHRSAPLSWGQVEAGHLRCRYHGWLYAASGEVIEVPSLGPGRPAGGCALRAFAVTERDGYIYVRLTDERAGEFSPFPIPHHGEPGWGHVRLVSHFRAGVTECAENFVNVPHTAWVHPGLFRSRRDERLRAEVARRGGSVTVVYRGERRNLGVAARFLNGVDREIGHRDAFHMPNVTCVEYDFGLRRRFAITSQSVPVSTQDTLVHTDLTYDYGVWTSLARWPVRWLARRIIDQDREVLARQAEVVRRTGMSVTHTAADLVYVWIDGIRRDLEQGRDPRRLPAEVREIDLWV